MSFTKPEQVEESLDGSSSEEQDPDFELLMAKCMELTNILARLKNHPDAYKLTQLHPADKQKIKTLRKLQIKTTNLDAKFLAEVYALECRYHQLCVPLYEKRKQVVMGTYEPTDQEAQWSSDDEDENLRNQLKNKVKIEKKKTPYVIPKIPVTQDKPTGIPNFWLTIFQNVDILSKMVQPHDVPILTHLQDIKVDCSENPKSFTLAFHFSPNQYFTNSVLTKEYFIKCDPDHDNPFGVNAPKIYKCKGCTINWNEGMNVTLKTVKKKKQKHRRRGGVCTVITTVEDFSLFNFFAPPEVPENIKEEEIDNELHYVLNSDFEIGQYIRENVIPKAVLFYLSESTKHDYKEHDDYKKYDNYKEHDDYKKKHNLNTIEESELENDEDD